MINYRAGKWGILFAFSLEGSVFPKAVVFALPCAVLAAALNYIFLSSENFNHIKEMINGNGGALGGFYFVLGFLIVFRSQNAYARWWEGGSLLQQMRGEWFNAFSACLAFCNTAPEKARDVDAFQHKLARLTSMLYGAALTDVSEMSESEMEFLDFTGFSDHSLAFLEKASNKSEIVLQWIQRLIHEASGADTIKVAPPILSRVYNQLGNGIVMLNNAQKLSQFPVPFPVAQMIFFMLMFHWCLTCLVCAASVSTPYWAFFEAFVVVFVYWGVHYISQELEQPFGDDLNDLPIADMMQDMNDSLKDLMSFEARGCPNFDYNPDLHDDLKTKKLTLGPNYLSKFQMKKSASLDLEAACSPRMSLAQAHEPPPRTYGSPGTPHPAKRPLGDAQAAADEMKGNPMPELDFSNLSKLSAQAGASFPEPQKPDASGKAPPGGGGGGGGPLAPGSWENVQGGKQGQQRPLTGGPSSGQCCPPVQKVGSRLMVGTGCLGW